LLIKLKPVLAKYKLFIKNYFFYFLKDIKNNYQISGNVPLPKKQQYSKIPVSFVAVNMEFLNIRLDYGDINIELMSIKKKKILIDSQNIVHFKTNGFSRFVFLNLVNFIFI
jgi:hypothetical protein